MKLPGSHSKTMEVTLSQEQKTAMRRAFGLGVSAEIRRWIEADTHSLSANRVFRTEGTTTKLIVLITVSQWDLLRAKAAAMHTFPARLVRQIIADRLEHLPTQPKGESHG